jgi:TRAP-type C4-dicarboxylate transport system permease small subunit
MQNLQEKSWLRKSSLSICVFFETASNVAVRVARPICFVLLLAIVIVLLMEIFFRRVQILNVTWSEEVAKMLCVALTIISSSVALRKGFHIGTTYILMKIKNNKVIYFLNLIAQLFILAFLFLAVYYGFQYSIGISYQTSPSVGVSMFWPHLSIPIGSLMMFVHSGYFLMKNLNGLLAIGDD